MTIDASRLAAELAARIAPILPPSFQATADGTDFQLDHRLSDRCFAILLDWLEEPDEDRSDAELAELGVKTVLSSVQDVVSEASTEPWPALSRRIRAMPGTRCDGLRVYFWYGPDEQSPVIPFTPIVLAGVVRGP